MKQSTECPFMKVYEVILLRDNTNFGNLFKLFNEVSLCLNPSQNHNWAHEFLGKNIKMSLCFRFKINANLLVVCLLGWWQNM